MAMKPAENPMLTMLFKSMGIDPTILLQQTRDVVALFERIAAAQEKQGAQLLTIQTALGVAPPPDEETLKLIADESRKYTGEAAA